MSIVKMLFVSLITLVMLNCNQKEQYPSSIQKLIAEDSAMSLHEAAGKFEYGEGVPVNIVEAAKLYYKAAQKGNYHSHYSIWRLWEYFSSNKTEPPFELTQFSESKKEAISGYTRLLLNHPDDPEIYFRLGQLYDPGIGIDNQESKTARAMLSKAASMGHSEAKDCLIQLDKIEQQLITEQAK